MKLRKGDFIAVLSVAFLAVAIWIFLPSAAANGETVIISHNGEEVYRAPLSENRETELFGCTIEILDGRARVKNATCPDKVCEKSGTAENAGDIIVCVPNRISIEISGEREFDAIAA